MEQTLLSWYKIKQFNESNNFSTAFTLFIFHNGHIFLLFFIQFVFLYSLKINIIKFLYFSIFFFSYCYIFLIANIIFKYSFIFFKYKIFYYSFFVQIVLIFLFTRLCILVSKYREFWEFFSLSLIVLRITFFKSFFFWKIHISNIS